MSGRTNGADEAFGLSAEIVGVCEGGLQHS